MDKFSKHEDPTVIRLILDFENYIKGELKDPITLHLASYNFTWSVDQGLDRGGKPLGT